ncbi:MAG: efflux RND transporter permease subunit [Victivallales bacterium]|nr:efflux RND transporter permease subunit [Victivallales bacterium]
MLARFFIKRPRFAVVISIVLSLAGVWAMMALPVAQYPEVTPPQVKVSTLYPGASSSVLANTVAAPLEEEINGVDGMLYMSSKSDDTGNYELTITFEVGTDRDIAQVNVQNRIQQARARLPAEVIREGISVTSESASMLGALAFLSPEGSHDRVFIANYLHTHVKNALKRIPGIGAATVLGPEFSMRVWLDSDRMNAVGLTPNDVANAIQSQNLEASLGTVGGAPDGGEGRMMTFPLQAQGRLNDPDAFKDLVVRSAQEGGLVHLKDIARVVMGGDLYSIESTYNGVPAVCIQLNQTPRTNAINAMEAVSAELARLSEAYPDDFEGFVSWDVTTFVRVSVKEVATTLFLTFLLVVLVCYVFLQDWRATLIPAAAIPVSLLATFIVLAAFGYSINLLTLFALVLVIGTVVDNAIMVVERVIHIMESEGLDHRAAAAKAMGDISGAMVASTLVLLAIFVPIAFVGGMSGRIYRQFAVSCSAAVIFSLLVALTLSPALCATLLRVPRPVKRGPLAWFNKILARTRRSYVAVSVWVARRTAVTVVCVLLVGGMVWLLFSATPTAFIPDEDQGVIFANIQLPEGAALERTRTLLERVSPWVRETPGVKAVMNVAGFSLIGGRGENSALMIIDLKHWDKRPSRDQSTAAIMVALRARLATVPEADINLFVPPAIMGMGANGGQDMRVQAFANADPLKLEAATGKLLARLNQTPELMFAFSTYTARTPRLHLDIDREKAQALHVPVANIFGTLQTYLGKRYVNDISIGSQVKQVLIRADAKYRGDIEDVKRLYVKSMTGAMVPLAALVTIRTALAPRTLDRHNLFPSAQITALNAPMVSSGQAVAAMERVAKEVLPKGYGFDWAGMSYQEKRTSNQTTGLILMALVFGYLFLVAQYESWTIPIPVVLSLSVAILGALLGLSVCGLPLGTYAQLGAIMLVGIASKNAILIIEFAKQQREAGCGIIASASTGASERFRAVLMTAFTFILGTLPMVFATGAGANSRRAIGTTVFSGMLAATMFGIVLIPALYVLFQQLREGIKARTGFGGIPATRMATPLLLVVLAAVMTGCLSVGPDHQSLALPEPDYTDLLGRSGQPSVVTAELLANWWESFQDPTLTRLVGAALANSPDLKEARARVRAAQARLGGSRARLLPWADSGVRHSYGVANSESALGISTQESDFFHVGFDAFWELDVFGGTRRAVEAATNDVRMQEALSQAVWVSLAGAVASTYVELRVYQRRLAVTESNLHAQAQTFDLLRSRHRTGLVDELAVEQARYNLERTRASIPGLRSRIEAAMNGLAVLAGQLPGTLHKGLHEATPLPAVPFGSLTRIPADRLRRRPDVRQAEYAVAAQTARIGQATAELYPKFALVGSIGYEALHASDLSAPQSRVSGIGPSVSWPIFHAGAIRSNIRVQTARQEEMLARYEKTVLRAVGEVRDALKSFAEEQHAQAALAKACRAASAADEISRDRYANGLVDFSNVLDAQRARLQLEEQLVVSEGLIFINLIRLYKALGGGWEAAILASSESSERLSLVAASPDGGEEAGRPIRDQARPGEGTAGRPIPPGTQP